MTRDEAYQLVTTWTTSQNLIKHMLCVEAAMNGLAVKFEIANPKSEMWGTLGLVHDADYEKYPDKHPGVLIKELEDRNENEEIINAVKAHAWGYNGFDREPQTPMEWSIYCADELTGFIVAVTLIRPNPPSPKATEGSKRLSRLESVTVQDVLKKWKEKGFARGVDRSHTELCEEKLGIALPDFMQIVLTSMQNISEELGL
jgi:predicted hydrolase (HD superfamily)